jgi:hypothetical protein
MTFFTQEKGTLLPEKGHLAKLGGLAPPGTPGSYAPVLMSKLEVLSYKSTHNVPSDMKCSFNGNELVDMYMLDLNTNLVQTIHQ